MDPGSRVVLKAFPLAKEVRLFLEQNQKNLLSISRKEMSELEVAKLKSKLMDKFKEANISQPAKTVDSIIALGKILSCDPPNVDEIRFSHSFAHSIILVTRNIGK